MTKILICLECGSPLEKLSRIRYTCSNPNCNCTSWIKDGMLYNYVDEADISIKVRVKEAVVVTSTEDQSEVIKVIPDVA